jgi:folate-dependent phosphoribosylglycinamide formyltransferase PurN
MLRPLSVAILCSRRCPGAAELLRDRRRGWRWRLAGVLTSEEDFTGRRLLEAAGISVVSHPIRDFYHRRRRPLSDLTVRREYDEELVKVLSVYDADLVLLSGYLFRVTPPLLDAFGGRVVNVHGSDLTRLGTDGLPRYLGLRAIRDAVFAGEGETRATAHWVTDEIDLGPPIARSPAFPVPQRLRDARSRGDLAALKAGAREHEERMLEEAWGPLWIEVIRLFGAHSIVPPPRCTRPLTRAAGEVAW